MKLQLVKGAAGQTINVFIQDSSSTTGAGLTGLVYNSAGLKAYYVRPRAASVAITLATQTVTGAYSSGGFVEIDATNMPGVYRLDLPDAVLASGVDHVFVLLSGAANMAPLPLEIQLTDIDVNDGVRAGLTALPNAAAGTNGGLPLGDGSGDVTLANGPHGGASATISAERIIVASTTVNEPAIKLTGNGTGSGLQCIGGATGDGLVATAGGGNTIGLNCTGSGSGSGIKGTGGASGAGLEAAGGTTGDGARFSGGTTSGHGLECLAAGTGNEIDANITGNVSGSIGSLSSQAKADVNAECDTALADYGALKPTVAGRTLDVTATGAAGIDWANIEGQATAVALSGTTIGTCTSNTDMRGTDNALLAASAPTNFGDLAITATTGRVTVGTNADKTGYSISGTKTTLDALNDVSAADVNAQCDTALSDISLHKLLSSAAVFGTDVVSGSVIDQLSDDGTASFDRTTDSLQAIRDRGDAAWSASASTPSVLVDTTIASLTSQTVFVLTAGSSDDDAYKDQAVVLYDASNSNFPSVRKCSSYVGATRTMTIDSAPDFTIVAADGVKAFVTAPGTTAPTAAQNADAVWDELNADHRTIGTMGEALQLAKASLTNKRTHTISTGVDQVFDDDGTTVLKTMTPDTSVSDKVTLNYA